MLALRLLGAWPSSMLVYRATQSWDMNLKWNADVGTVIGNQDLMPVSYNSTPLGKSRKNDPVAETKIAGNMIEPIIKGTVPNYGFMLRLEDTESSGIYGTCENPTQSYRPSLTVYYRLGSVGAAPSRLTRAVVSEKGSAGMRSAVTISGRQITGAKTRSRISVRTIQIQK